MVRGGGGGGGGGAGFELKKKKIPKYILHTPSRGARFGGFFGFFGSRFLHSSARVGEDVGRWVERRRLVNFVMLGVLALGVSPLDASPGVRLVFFLSSIYFGQTLGNFPNIYPSSDLNRPASCTHASKSHVPLKAFSFGKGGIKFRIIKYHSTTRIQIRSCALHFHIPSLLCSSSLLPPSPLPSPPPSPHSLTRVESNPCERIISR